MAHNRETLNNLATKATVAVRNNIDEELNDARL
jgi:hypothetical protein